MRARVWVCVREKAVVIQNMSLRTENISFRMVTSETKIFTGPLLRHVPREIYPSAIFPSSSIPGGEEEFEGASAGDPRGDANGPKLDRLYSQPVREGEESLQLHDTLLELPDDDPGDRRGGRAVFNTDPIPDPRLGRQ